MSLEIVILGQDAGPDELFLEDIHEVQKVLGLAAADVVDGIRRDRQAILTLLASGRAGHHSHDALHDVVHVGEVPAAVAVVVDLDRLAGEQLVRESEICHIRPPSGTIHREKPEARRGNIIQLAVAVGHQLIALLGSGVEAHRVVHAVVRAEWDLLVAAVDGTGAGVHKVLHRMVPARFEDIVESDNIALDVGVRVLDAVAYAGLRREVHHDVELLFGEKGVRQGLVGDGAADEAVGGLRFFALAQNDTLRAGNDGLYLPKPVLLQADVVIIIQIVQPHDPARLPLKTLTKQPHHQIAPDKPGTAGH